MNPAKIAWAISIIIWALFTALWLYSYKIHWYEGTLLFVVLQFTMLIPICLFAGMINHWW